MHPCGHTGGSLYLYIILVFDALHLFVQLYLLDGFSYVVDYSACTICDEHTIQNVVI